MKQSEEVSAANNGENNFVYSLTEVAEKLVLPLAKVRNYMISFGLESKKDGRKVLLSELSIKFLEQVVRLKANGWSLQQIRNFISGNTSVLPNVTPQHEESKNFQKEIEPLAAPFEEEEKKEKEKEQENRTQKNLKETLHEEEQEQKEQQQEERKEEIREERRHPQQDSKKKQQSQDEYIPLTKEFLNEEITSQSKKLGRLRKALAMIRASQKDLLETNADIDRRYVFIAGLRHIRDNWVEKNAS